MAAKGGILAVTNDPAFVHELEPAASARDYELRPVSTIRAAAARLACEDFSAVVFDCSRFPGRERPEVLAARGPKPVALFWLETASTLSPTESLGLRCLPWPLPAGFAGQVSASDKIIAFLVGPGLFEAGTLPSALRQEGVRTVVLESAIGLIELAAKRAAPPDSGTSPGPKESSWERLEGENSAPEEGPGNVFVAPFLGGFREAEVFDEKLRQAAPEAVCYYVSGLEIRREAAQAARAGRPFSLPREQLAKVPAILDESSGQAPESRHGGSILLLGNAKPELEDLARSLGAAGYEVSAALDGEQALGMAAKPGSFDLAVIGAAPAFAKLGGTEIARKLRQADPDLGIVFVADRADAATDSSEVAVQGLDGALWEPVEPARLLLCVRRALERRSLLLENRRFLKEARELSRFYVFQKKFFSLAAHDLRNQLTAILGYCDLLKLKLKKLPEDSATVAQLHLAAKTMNQLLLDLVGPPANKRF